MEEDKEAMKMIAAVVNVLHSITGYISSTSDIINFLYIYRETCRRNGESYPKILDKFNFRFNGVNRE